ncbi:BTB/POZ domain-containing protein 8-like isoform X2 [Ptychodera flava]|uniref:BTB/POZ domain-containing protein 8-like isoform X2 n=1 Tax=Ptychodera flava TaxID=63121 RepID=UPI00396A4D59
MARHVGSQMSEAFIEKTAKEKARLIHKLANQLKADMARLLEDTENADIILVAGGEHLLSHKIMLQTRVPEFFNYFIGKNSTAKKIMIHHVVADDLKAFLRDIYSLNEISPWREVIREWIERQEKQKSLETSLEEMDISGKNHKHMMITSDDDVAMVPVEEEDDIEEQGACGAALAMDMNADIDHFKFEDCRDEVMKSMELEMPESKSIQMNGKSRDFDEENVIQDTFLKANVPEPTCYLAKDLLEMFINQESTDITLRVEDKKIRAHRFMLCCRSNYFTAMLCGGWAESSAEEICLFDVSCTTALGALYYIYGGVMEEPHETSVGELVQMSDMYGLDGLKDNAAFILRRDKCHFFHKPCNACISGVPECLALATVYGLHAIAENCLRWIAKHLDKVWCTKAFVTQSQEILEHSYDFAISSLCQDNAVAMAMQCDKLLTSLPNVKWVEPVHHLATSLHMSCVGYIVDNFCTIINHETFGILLSGMAWSATLVEAIFNTAIDHLTVDNACKMFIAVNSLKGRAEFQDWNQDIVDMINMAYTNTLNYVVNNVNFLLHSKEWHLIPDDLREKIKRDAIFVDDSRKMPAPKPLLTSSYAGSQGVSAIKRPSRLPTSLRKTTSASTEKQPVRPKTAIPVVNKTRPSSMPSPKPVRSKNIVPDKPVKERPHSFRQPKLATASRAEQRAERNSTNVMDTRSNTVPITRPSTLSTKSPPGSKQNVDKPVGRQSTRRPASASPTVLRSTKTTPPATKSPTSPTENRSSRYPNRTFVRSQSDGTKDRLLNRSQNTNIDTDKKENIVNATSKDSTPRIRSNLRSPTKFTRSRITSPRKELPDERDFSSGPVKASHTANQSMQSNAGARPKVPPSPKPYRSTKTTERYSPDKFGEQQSMEVEAFTRHTKDVTSMRYSFSGQRSGTKIGRTLSDVGDTAEYRTSSWRRDGSVRKKERVVSPRKQEISDAESGQFSRESSMYSSSSDYSYQDHTVRPTTSPDSLYEPSELHSPRQLRSPVSPGRSSLSSQSPADGEPQLKSKHRNSWRRYQTTEYGVYSGAGNKETSHLRYNQSPEQKSPTVSMTMPENQDYNINSSSSPGSSPGSPGRKLGTRNRPRSGIPRPITTPSPTYTIGL